MAPEGTNDLDGLLRPKHGEISYHHPSIGPPQGGTWSIVIPLEPLSSDDQYSTTWRPGADGPEIIRTRIVLDFIDLPVDSLKALAGRSFEFPTNPNPGYIDGSVYLAAAHNPVDVARLRFGRLHEGAIEVRVECDVNFEVELWNVPKVHLTIDSVLARPT